MNILDLLTGVTLITSIYLIGIKPKIGWSLYIINCVLYSFLMYANNLYVMVVVGLTLMCLGIKNLKGVLNG